MFLIPDNNPKDIFIASSVKDNLKKSEEVDEKLRYLNEKSFFEEIGLDMEKSIFMRQTHSDNIVKIDNSNYLNYNKRNPVLNTDALITNIKNVALVIQTADCLPLILYCQKTKSMAAIHAGWRGVVSCIIPKTVRFMHECYDADPSFIYSYIGAHIFKENYEVGLDVAEKFENKSFENGSYYVDIAEEAKLQMIKEGLSENNIELSKLNSYNDMFYSYRRDGKQIGRILTLGIIK